jgi:endonuclease YncB( thermonuclease family)
MFRSSPILVKSFILSAALCMPMVSVCSSSIAQVEPRPMPELVVPQTADLIPAVLHKVIDGDSVELFVQGRIIRYELVGADAPDLIKATETPLFGSVEARDFLHSLLVGEQLAVLPDKRKPTDALGRSRGYVYRMPDKLLVNLELVRVGHAKHTRDPSGFNNAAFRWAQDRARDASKGVWAPRPEPIKPPKPTPAEPESKPEPLPQDQPEVAPTQSEPENPLAASDVVYVTESGSKYHTKDCRHTSDSSVTKKRSEVQKTHKPCKVCQPDKDA